MNADEAKRNAIRALSVRLGDWGVDDAERKAWSYVNDLGLAGWLWMPPTNRATPPKPEEACVICGRRIHPPDAVCSTPTTRPAPKADDVTSRVTVLRHNVVPLRPAKPTPPEGDPA